jgi:predicted nucleic-acid-binding Zn-ribbon protein
LTATTPASCAKCGNAEILGGVRVKVAATGTADEVRAVVAPTSGMIRAQTGSEMRAWICAACGYTEMYAMEPQVLAERWRAGER